MLFGTPITEQMTPARAHSALIALAAALPPFPPITNTCHVMHCLQRELCPSHDICHEVGRDAWTSRSTEMNDWQAVVPRSIKVSLA